MKSSLIRSLIACIRGPIRNLAQLLHGVELIPSILILPLIFHHMEVVATCCVGSRSLLADDGILTAAKIISLRNCTNTIGSSKRLASIWQLPLADCAGDILTGAIHEAQHGSPKNQMLYDSNAQSGRPTCAQAYSTVG